VSKVSKSISLSSLLLLLPMFSIKSELWWKGISSFIRYWRSSIKWREYSLRGWLVRYLRQSFNFFLIFLTINSCLFRLTKPSESSAEYFYIILTFSFILALLGSQNSIPCLLVFMSIWIGSVSPFYFFPRVSPSLNPSLSRS
jgi:hypothetical protein